MIYNAVLVSDVQKSDSVIHLFIGGGGFSHRLSQKIE